MTDIEITREKTFSEELPYFKERIKEVFDNYHNTDGSEDPLYIAILRDSVRIVRKAEEEINYQKVEIKQLKECPKCVYEYDGETMEYCVQGPCPNFNTVEQIKAEAYKEFADKLKKHSRKMQSSDFSGDFWDAAVLVEDIDNLVQELVGGGDAEEL